MTLNRVQALPPDDAREARFDIVHADSIRFFPELVQDLGGDPEALLRRARIDPQVLAKRGSVLEYRSMVQLFEIAAAELRCPDFGMKLAALQGGTRVMGPIGVVMKNSQTLGQALGYCAKQIRAYSLATRVRFMPDRANHKLFLALEILIDGLSDKSQVVEHALLLATLNAMDVTGGTAHVRQVSFRHLPLSPPSVYQGAFGCEVLFGAKADGIVFDEQDLLCPVIDPDEQLYEMATSFISDRYPPGTPPMHARVRALINRYLGSEDCTNERVAGDLCMHPRTLQRRLKCEGRSFESIKDEVRREVAMRYLQRPDMPLTQVAEKLGYAEQSVLSRSCYRWFSASPRELRERSLAEDRPDSNM
ncbi:MAG TPA: AraC family transcriptional regulator ligand-binding domain-containing protein [Steroidobacteraceae bacterium]|nr:AraC family transcriptional regulator ligand-binding domain-containing protein [Steroidobacteraceae bacterium]